MRRRARRGELAREDGDPPNRELGRPAPVCVPVREDADVAIARLRARVVARAAGLEHAAVEAVATAVSEIARNIIVHARAGEISLGVARNCARCGVLVVARDDGPGIADVAQAMRDGFSTAHGLGLGLSSARRLMDDFDVSSQKGHGTTVTMKKWSS